MKFISRIPAVFKVWGGAYLFFLCFLANNFSASHDSIHYLYEITRGVHLFYPHHLLYHFLAHYWLVALREILPFVPDHYLVEAFTALWGSSVLAMVYQFLRVRFELPIALAVAGVGVVAFSFGTWFYSVNIEVYTPPLFFILAALYVLTAPSLGNKDIVKIMLLHSLAILFHQANILFVPVVIYGLVSHKGSLKMRTALLRYAIGGILVVGGAYLFTGWLVEGHSSWSSWIRWMQGYTVGHDYWRLPGISTPLNVAAGFSRAFIGGHFLFRLPLVDTYLQQSFSAHGLQDEIFLVSGVSPVMACVLTLLTLVFGLLVLALVVRFITRYPLVRRHAPVVRPLMLCLVIYSLFFCFWIPEILEFWILQMVLFWLLLLGLLPLLRFPFNIPPLQGALTLCLLLFLVNFFGSMRWLRDVENDWYYRELDSMRGSIRTGDLVIVENSWIMKDFVRYYTGARVIASDEPGYDEGLVEEEVREARARNARVFIYRGQETGSGSRGWFIQSD